MITANAAGSFTYDGKNLARFKGESAVTIATNLSSKQLSSIASAYKKASTNFAKVTSLTFSDKVTVVTSKVFKYFPNVKTLTIGKAVTDLPETDGFTDDGTELLTKLTTIQVASDNPNYCAKGGVLYNKKKTKLIKVPYAYSKSSYGMPKSVTRIGGDYAFNGCPKLKTLTISVSFEGNLKNLQTLPKLRAINVAAGNKEYVSNGGVLYNAQQTKLVAWPTAKSAEALTFPDTLKELNTDVLPTSATSITIPMALENMYSDSRDKHYYPKAYPLNALVNLKSVSVADGNTHFTVYGGALYNAKKTVCYGIPMCTQTTEITLSEGLTIENSALLYGHETITKLILPSSLKVSSPTDILGGEDTLTALTAFEVVSPAVSGDATASADATAATTTSKKKNEAKLLTSNDGVLYSLDGKDLYCYPIAKSGAEYTIPDTVENVHENALSGKCKALAKVTFGKSVKALGANYGINLPNLEEYAVSEENKTFCVRDGVLYDKKMTVICGYPRKKKDKSFTVVGEITDIAYYNVFANDYLKELNIEGDLDWLPSELVRNLPALESFSAGKNAGFTAKNGVLYTSDMKILYAYPAALDASSYTMPDSVETVRLGALVDNPYIKTVAIGAKCSSVNSDDEYGLGVGCKKLQTIKVSAKNKYFTVKNGVLYNKKITELDVYPEGLKAKSFTLPKTVKTIIPKCAFANNKALKSLRVESGNKRFVSDGKDFYIKSSGKLYAGLSTRENQEKTLPSQNYG